MHYDGKYRVLRMRATFLKQQMHCGRSPNDRQKRLEDPLDGSDFRGGDRQQMRDAEDGVKQLRKINGKEIPAFEYVIGNPRPRLSRTAVKKGKEYTFYLRNLIKERIKNNNI